MTSYLKQGQVQGLLLAAIVLLASGMNTHAAKKRGKDSTTKITAWPKENAVKNRAARRAPWGRRIAAKATVSPLERSGRPSVAL